MQVFHDPLRDSNLPSGGLVTIGNFDGMHAGHQAIVKQVVERAEELNAPSIVVTFNPHPLSVVAPDRAPAQILTIGQKKSILSETRLDALIIVPFTPEFSRWTAERFVKEVLVERLNVSQVYIGKDFCFGAGREGTLETLQEMGKVGGFSAHGVSDVTERGIRVSSSIVRDAIAKGAMRTARVALNRAYFVDGRVETGRRLGRKLGFPTVNLAPHNDLFPGVGVYATSCRFNSFARTFESVTNIGVRPTLHENCAITIESHVLDFDSNVYDDEARVFFHRLIRREKRFESPAALTDQIARDVATTRRYFLRHPLET